MIQKFCLFFLFGVLSVQSFAQVKVSGRVLDKSSDEALVYASVILRGAIGQKPFAGVTSDESGKFNIQSDSAFFTLEIRVLGYESLVMDSLKGSNGSLALGDLKMSPLDKLLQEVTVRQEKSMTEFRLDKRVFNVGQDISSSGASALEVLNHVPSVTVSIDGIISLRGSAGVQILIDGKPSVMSDDPGKALGTITADMIERVEVMTNPSAKYESEGTSGIINIVLKKEEKKGLNGSFSVNTGWPHNHSFGISLNRRTEHFNLFTQMGAGYRSLPRYNKGTNRNLLDSTEIISDGINYRNEQFYNVTLGTDYHVNKYNVITLSGNFAYEIEQQPSETNFTQSVLGQTKISEWTRTEVTGALNPKYQYDLQYKKTFRDTVEHTLLFSTLGRFFGKEQSSDFSNRTTFGNVVYDPQRTKTNFKQADYTFKLDYNKPFRKYYTLESGAMYNMNDVGNNYEVQDEVNGSFVTDSALTNHFIYKQNVLGVYSTGSYEGKKWGLKLGLRMENTDLKTELVTTGRTDNQNYTNFFPTLHTSYKISRRISFQAGYSRRVYRPRLWDLNPFFNISNNFNVRRGNPELLPEFTDSYELTSIYIFEKISMNLGVYYRYTDQTIDRVSLFENNVNTVLPMNIGTNGITGVEFNAKYTPVKWWVISGDMNYNLFNRKGEFQGQSFDFNGDKWQGKLMFKFKCTKSIDLELTGNHESGFKTVQGTRAPMTYLDSGVRVKLMKGKGIINLGVRDAFASRIEKTTVDQTTYYLYTESTRGRFLTFGFSYGFGKGEAMTYSGRRPH
ncbi:MAG: TonB-dependent receptor [Bacteroidetes bacterium]|nr:MAG: TonB-dependent receptor [Bacteroidota bacterium]